MGKNTVEQLKAIVLGGTFSHIALIDNLKRRGFYTILIDYLSDPPAKSFADEHVQESTLDKEKILKIAEDRSVSLVISACLDQPLTVVSEVSEKLGLSSYINLKTAIAVTNKVEMKRIFEKYKIPSARWKTITKKNTNATEALQFPLVTKQISGTGSIGLAIIHKKENFEAITKRTFETAPDSEILVEEFHNGREFSIDVIVIDSKSHLLLIRERHNIFTHDGSIIQCYGSVTPVNLSTEQEVKIKELSQNIADAFSLVNSPLLIQIIMTKKNEFSVVEIAARLSGGMLHFVIPQKTGFDLLDATVSCYLKEPINIKLNSNSDYYAMAFIYASGGIIYKLIGFDDLFSDGLVEKIHFLRKKGDSLPKNISAKNRIVEIVIKAPNKIELKEKIKKIFNQVDVLGPNKSSLMLRNFALYKTL
jgi:biotin carboxylase